MCFLFLFTITLSQTLYQDILTLKKVVVCLRFEFFVTEHPIFSPNLRCFCAYDLVSQSLPSQSDLLINKSEAVHLHRAGTSSIRCPSEPGTAPGRRYSIDMNSLPCGERVEALMLSEAKGASLGRVTWRLDVSSSLILPQALDSQSLWVPGCGGFWTQSSTGELCHLKEVRQPHSVS